MILKENNNSINQEQKSQTLYIYEDEDTGIKYIFNGEKLVPINAPQDPGDPSKPELDKFDKEELARQDEERQKQIDKELEEYGDAVEEKGADSAEAKSRLEEISDLLNDAATAQDLLDETDRIVRQDYQKRAKERKEAEKAAQKYTANQGIDNFVLDLNKLIKTEVKKVKKDDWGKINKKYSRSGLLKPGHSMKKNPQIPRLFVYYDQSGSWSESDIEIGDKAISTLNVFVQKKQLVIEVYFFADDVHTTAQQARWEGGTGAGEKVLQHIQSAKPDNVIIMTDSDFDWYGFKDIHATVSGGAFMLFRRGNVSKWLVNNLHGKKLTKIYSF